MDKADLPHLYFHQEAKETCRGKQQFKSCEGLQQ